MWGDNMEGNNDFIYTHIKNLRKKLSERPAMTIILNRYTEWAINFLFNEVTFKI